MNRRSFFKSTVGALAAAALLKDKLVQGILRRGEVTFTRNQPGSLATVLQRSDGDYFVTVGEVRDIELPDVGPDDGLKRASDFTFSTTGADHPLPDNDVITYRISFPDGTGISFQGFCVALDRTDALYGLPEDKLTIIPTGPAVFGP